MTQLHLGCALLVLTRIFYSCFSTVNWTWTDSRLGKDLHIHHILNRCVRTSILCKKEIPAHCSCIQGFISMSFLRNRICCTDSTKSWMQGQFTRIFFKQRIVLINLCTSWSVKNTLLKFVIAPKIHKYPHYFGFYYLFFSNCKWNHQILFQELMAKMSICQKQFYVSVCQFSSCFHILQLH